MKRIKIFIIIIMLLFMSGCTVKYNITIDKNGYLKEEITATELNTYLGEKPYENVSTRYKKYSAVAKFKGYTSESVKKSKESGMYLSSSHNNICDYINYSLTPSYIFNSMKCIETDKYYEIINDGEYLGGCPGCNDEANNIDKLYITFNLSKKAIASNADKVIKNKYIWTIDRMTTQDKNFMLKIEKPVIKNNNYDIVIYIIIIIIIVPIAYLIFKTIIMALKNKN